MTLPPDSYCPYCCTFSGECTCLDEYEEFEWVTNYSAQEFHHVGDVARRYREKGWATPISGDHTTIRERFLR